MSPVHLERLALYHGSFQLTDVDVYGDFIATADLIRSCQLLLLHEVIDNKKKKTKDKHHGGEMLKDSAKTYSVEELAIDPRPRWLTSVKLLQDDLVIAADMLGNMVLLSRENSQPVPDSMKGVAGDNQMQGTLFTTKGLVHVGEQVNKMISGKLVWSEELSENLADADVTGEKEPINRKSVISMTKYGKILVNILLSDAEYVVLARLQRNLLKLRRALNSTRNEKIFSYTR